MNNRRRIGLNLDVLIEKESKKSTSQWAGRIENNVWVIFDKKDGYKIGDIVNVNIIDAKGISLFGNIN